MVYWKITKPSERGDTDGEDEAGGGKRGSFFVRYYNVFNLAQVDGATLPGDTAPELPESERIAHAEAFIAALPGLDLRHGGGMAFYMPSQDRVQMPPFADFKNAEGYYSVLYHELTHWVGAKHRLDRDLTGRFGSAGYAAEELVVRRVGAIEGVKTCLLGSWDNPCVPDLPVPVMNRLKSRKGNGTRACRDKAQTAEAIVGPAGQHKMRMVKAILPEPQSPGRYPPQRCSDGCNTVPCRYRDATRPGLKRVMRSSTLGPASTACPSSRGSKGRTGRLSASHLLNA